jgi:adenylate cyclase class IV
MKEKEHKYRLSEKINEIKSFISTSNGFGDYEFREKMVFTIRDNYYDTEGLTLFNSPGYLRIRNKNGERFITLKRGFSEDPDEIDEIRHSLNDKGLWYILKHLAKWFDITKEADFSNPSFEGVLASIGMKPCLSVKMKRIQRNVYPTEENLHEEMCRLRFDEFYYSSISKTIYYELEIINFRRIFDEAVNKFEIDLAKHLNMSFAPSGVSKFMFGVNLARNK